MATGENPLIQSGEHLNDLLKCNICLETLKEPKLLPCLHTFCKSCIRTYYDSFKEKKKEIRCPVCRQIAVSQTSDDVDDFCETLPTNHFIVTLLTKSSMAKSEKFCDSCKFHGNENKATSWCGICDEAFCEQCAKCHKGFKMSADHELIALTDTDKLREWVNIPTVIFCDDHRKSAVQVYCVDHRKPCCTLCATLSHRKCQKVISIEEAASGVKQKLEVADLLQQMEENIKLLTDVIDFREKNETNMETESIHIETTVIKKIKEMKDHLDKIQNKILSELDATKKHTSLKVADDINDFTSYKSAITNWKSMLSVAVQHGSEQQCLNILNEISPKMVKLQSEIKDAMEKIRNVSIKFKESEKVKEFESTIQTIGDLKFKESKIKTEIGNLKSYDYDFRNGKIKVIRTVNVTQNGQTSGIFLDGLMVFAAYDSKKVVKYNMDGELLGERTVLCHPTDLCHMSETRAVISSNSRVLYIVDCKEMALKKTLNLPDVPVCGVCVYNSNQFLTGSQEKLTWIDQSSGTKIKSETTSGESFYVSTSANIGYIYGDGKNSVSYVVNDTKTFTYTNNQLSNPRGIGVDDEGNFYISGYNSKNIHQLTDTGKLIRIIPASKVGIEGVPWTLRFEPGTNRFLVTCNKSGKAKLCEINDIFFEFLCQSLV